MTVNAASILIVDDEPNVLATMQPIFELEGYGVDVAATEGEARRAIAAKPYDVVITDLRLAEADGLSLVDDLGRDQPGIPAIILTGFGSLESAIEAMHRGAYDYLLKPCDVDELKATVQRAISHGRLTRELRGTFSSLERLATSEVRPRDDELQGAFEEVNKLVADLDATKRDLELAFARERATVARLRGLDELKSQFISNVSHELRTPLTSIRGYAGLLAKRLQTSDELTQRAAAAIASASEQLQRLIEDLLDIAAIESGSLRVQPQPIDLAEAARAAVLIVTPMAQEKHLNLMTAIPADLPPVRADPARLAQVFNNVLGNAIKFTPEGGVITIEARRGAGLVHVLVSDTGLGIPPEEQPQVFSRFFRASTAPHHAAGLGLGLSISRGIIEAHSGLIWLQSEPGRGTTVHFTLPLAETAISAD